jgi:hypothetical protein
MNSIVPESPVRTPERHQALRYRARRIRAFGIVAASVMAFHYQTTGIAFSRAVRCRERLGLDFDRMLVLAVRWAGLRVMLDVERGRSARVGLAFSVQDKIFVLITYQKTRSPQLMSKALRAVPARPQRRCECAPPERI